MAAENIYGLKSILIGDIAVDGGPGTTLTEVIGQTVIDSAALTSTEATIEDINIEETDTAIKRLRSTPATLSLAFATYNQDPTVLQLLFGGTVTDGVWSAPVSGLSSVEKTVQVTTKDDVVITFPRMDLSAVLDWGFAKSRLGQTNITGSVLTPEKAGVAPWSVDFGVPAV